MCPPVHCSEELNSDWAKTYFEMDPEKLQLNRKNFNEDISAALGLMRHEEDFTDVTLVCKDDIPVRAHRVILASASSFFKSALLRRKVERQRILYLGGLTAAEVESALDFLYLGEVSVVKEEVASFIQVAQDLGLKGFERPEVGDFEGNAADENKSGETDPSETSEEESTLTNDLREAGVVVDENGKCASMENSLKETGCAGTGDVEELLVEEDIDVVSLSEENETNVEESRADNTNEGPFERSPPTATATSSPVRKRNRKEIRATLKSSLSHPDKDDEDLDPVEGCGSNDVGAVSIEQLESQIMSLMTRREGAWSCNLCGKKKRERSCLSRHIEGVHISGFRHPCNVCERTLTSRASLGAHKRKFHREHL